MPGWVIETGIEPEYESKLAASAEALGWSVYAPKFMPMDGGFEMLAATNGVYPMVFHGSLQAVEMAREQGWTVYENADQLMCSFYYPRIRDRLLNRDHIFMPFGLLTAHKEMLFAALGEDGCLFVRPDSNRKLFSGQLLKRETWDRDIELMGFYDDVVKPETMVVVARPINVEVEWRFFVAQGRVVTGSLYRRGYNHPRELATADALRRGQEFVDYCLEQKYEPDHVWVLDMCQTKAGNYHILEVGSFSSAGLYACDTDLLVAEVNRVTEEISP